MRSMFSVDIFEWNFLIVLNYVKKRVKAIGWEGVDWILPVQDKDVTGFCECGNEASDFIK